MTSMNINATVAINTSDIIDLICTGAEGGMCNTWVRGLDSELPEDADLSEIPEDMRDYPSYYAAFVEGGVIVFDVEDLDNEDNNVEVRLDKAAIEKALQAMATKYPGHFADFMDDNSDAITGDVFLQMAVYGDIIFG